MAYKPKILALTEGGTNASLTANNGGILYSTASAAAILSGTATANQVLLSGSSTTPAWSTATYPATAGTSGNVLQSDGTNFVSTAFTSPGSLNYATKTLTSAQVKALNVTQIEVVPAPGLGKVIIPISQCIYKLTYGGSNAFTGGGAVGVYWGTTVQAISSSAAITGTASVYNGTIPSSLGNTAIASLENIALNLFNTGSAFTGNAAGNNTVGVSFMYFIINI